ncbi:MAG: ATP-binding protein, partial [Thermoplasmata archaeon]|nr:ATP-binding protein [Thermoplasmata archaeon]
MSTLEMVLEMEGSAGRKEKANVSTSNVPCIRYFFGRKREMDEIRAALSTGARMIIITGMPGIGKTTLGVRIFHEYEDEMNVFWYPIHEWDTPRSILVLLSEFLYNMGKPGLKKMLRHAKKIAMDDIAMVLREDPPENSLFIFDDFQKATEDVERFLLVLREAVCRTEDGAVILLTRVLPSFYDVGEAVLKKSMCEIRLGGLDYEASLSLLEERGIDPERGGELYALTGGHPLALELIETKDGVEEGKDLMRYLYAEVSRRLTPEERDLMSFLSVYTEPVPVDMLLEKDFAYETVRELIKKSLLLEKADGRILQHDLIKSFFYDTMPGGEKRRRHVDAARAYEMEGGEHDSVMVIYHYLRGGEQQHAVERLLEYGGPLIKRGYSGEIRELVEELDEGKMKREHLAGVLSLKGDIYDLTGEWDRAIECYEASQRLNEEIGDDRGVARAALNIGRLYAERSMWEEALENFERCMDISGRINDQKLTADAYHNMGRVLFRRGELDRAKGLLKKSLAIYKKNRDIPGMAGVYTALANLHVNRGEYDEAIEKYSNALELLKTLGDKPEIARVYINIGVAHDLKGDREKALIYYEKEIELAGEIGDVRKKGYGLINASYAYLDMGNLTRAMEYCKEGLEIFTHLKEKLLIGDGYCLYASILAQEKEWDKSADYFEKSIGIHEDLKSIDGLSQTHLYYARMLSAKGDREKARTHLLKALEYYKKLGNEEKIKEIERELDALS